MMAIICGFSESMVENGDVFMPKRDTYTTEQRNGELGQI
jgi:hypothetical protein